MHVLLRVVGTVEMIIDNDNDLLIFFVFNVIQFKV